MELRALQFAAADTDASWRDSLGRHFSGFEQYFEA